eukprot:TRINITY_DN107180_c0_g1_i1.p1 TRINITY_DN107180_c0_g1~~TRINITY_DN107180_c0_g1_i1.p1  ORF type:complete len:540 (+),score=102.22 TRINITY_DN107180_c0_g1_i1:53-1672(+)
MRSDTSKERTYATAMAAEVRMSQTPASWRELLDKRFGVMARGSDLQTEIRAGFINWMTMSYILVVNPVILAAADEVNPVSTAALMTATALAACIGSLVVALIGDAPLGLMPGMGLNAYFSFGICRTFGVSFGQAMSCCFVSGFLLLILTALGICNFIVSKVLSEHLKKAITVAIGIFQALIGFQVMGLVVSSPDTLVAMGDLGFSNTQLYLALAGFSLISAMLVSHIHGALLIGILAMSICGWCTGLSAAPDGLLRLPTFDAAFILDFSCWVPASPKFATMVMGSMVLLFVALFDLAGVQYGLMSMAGRLEDGEVPRSSAIFSSAAIGTMSGALLGTSPVIIANESSAGIVEGSRTGISALVVSALFFMSAFLAPLLSAIPRVATSVPLVLIGAFMMAPCQGIDWNNLRAAIPSFLTITVVPFTYSIHNGIVAGILMDAFLSLISRACPPRQVAMEEPLLGISAPPSPLMEKVLRSTPHAMMAFGRDDASHSDKVEKAQQLLGELRKHSFSEESGGVTGESVLLAALEAFLESQEKKPN